MSAAERLAGVASCSHRCQRPGSGLLGRPAMGLRPPYLQQQQRRLWQRVAPRCWARSSQHHQQQQQLLLQQPPGQGPLCPLPLQRQPGEQAVPPWLSAGRPRRRVVPRAGQSWRDIGEDLVEIGEDLLERATSALSGEKRAKRRGAQQGPGSSPGGGPGGGGSSDEGGAPGSGDGGGLRGPPPPPPTSKTWAEWSNAGVDEDWDAWSGSVTPDLDDEDDIAELKEQIIQRRIRRAGKRSRVRDEYLRPIVDAQGIYNRLTYDEREAEERVFVEAITNQYESKEALVYAGWLVAIPLLVGFIISRLVAQPLWDFAERLDPTVFDLKDEQKIEGAHEVRLEEIRIRLEASLGRAPPLSDEAMLKHLAHEAQHIADEMRQHNKQALLNVVSDSTSAGVFFLMLLRDNSRRQILFRTIGRVFSGMSDTAKAFLIILFTDILLGYHSEEGWTAFLNIASRHYGVEPEREGIYIFVSTVPVFLDTCFKYWIFVGLNKEDPAAAVTLKQMDRH